jgi:hypothetical protein
VPADPRVDRDVLRNEASTVQRGQFTVRERTLKVMIVRLPTVARSLQARRIVFVWPASTTGRAALTYSS